MPKHYGVILTSVPTRVTRAIVQEGGDVLLQTLKVDDEIRLTQHEVLALTQLLEQEAEDDAILRELRRPARLVP